MSFVVNEDVGAFEVTVEDTLVMEIRHSLCNLVSHFEEIDRVERVQVLKIRHEAPILVVWRNEEPRRVTRCRRRAQKLEYVRVLKRLPDLHLEHQAMNSARPQVANEKYRPHA